MKYVKSQEDKEKEKYDLENNSVMLYLRNKDQLKFNVGDILIKYNLNKSSVNYHGLKMQEIDSWKLTMASQNMGVPKRYMYVFENELGIGYVRQLSIDGTRFTSNMICLANIDTRYTKFELDQDYADSLILGGNAVEEIQKKYQEIKEHRLKAMTENKKILIKGMQNVKKWLDTVNIGDIFYVGKSYDQLCESKWQILEIVVTPWEKMGSYDKSVYQAFQGAWDSVVEIKAKQIDSTRVREFSIFELSRLKLTDKNPSPLKI